MLDQATVAMVVAIGVLATPILFLATVVAAVVQGRRGDATGPRMGALLAFTGGLTVGGLILLTNSLAALLPLLVLPAVIGGNRWRAGRRAQTGWFVTGIALPWTLLWGVYLAVLLAGLERFDLGSTIRSFLFGAVPLVAGLVMALRGDPAWATADVGFRPGQPGSRSLGSVAAALRESTRVGPVTQPELALLVAVVATWVVVSFLMPAEVPIVVRVPLLAFIVAIVGAEAYVRGYPPRSRRAFEALSWWGEWALARVRAATGGGVPTTRKDAERWLASRPERPDQLVESMLRVEVLLLVERISDAADLVERIAPLASTPASEFEIASLRDLVQWCGGGEGNLVAVEAAVGAVLPLNGDDRLRAEVSLAVKRMRRLIADPTTARSDMIGPLLEARERLGPHANGQVGRALRPRLIPMLFAFLLVAALTFEVIAGLDARPL